MQIFKETFTFLSLLACAEASTSIEEIVGTKFILSDHRNSSSKSRIECDNKDTDKPVTFFKEHAPFSDQKNLKKYRNWGHGGW